MNVLDDAKLQAALTGVTDSAAKALATQVLPVAAAFVQAAVERLCTEAETVIGASLADLTAERKEIVIDVHAILDRLDGITLTIHIPRKDPQ